MKRILSALLCAAVCLTGFSGCGTPAKESSRLKLLASFYPIAIMALNITDGVEGVAVESMAQQQTGCLHRFPDDNRRYEKGGNRGCVFD